MASSDTSAHGMTGSSADAGGRGLVVWPCARAGMRVFRPTVWLVLQDVALDAELRDGRFVASTSARLVATHLRIDPGTAATALRTLRDRGVVELSQAAGPNGRFGLATYTLHLPEGIDALRPCTEPSYTENPDTGTAHRDEDLVFSCPWEAATVPSPEPGPSYTVESRAATAQRGASAHRGPPAGIEVSSPQRDPVRAGMSCIVDARTDPDVAPSRSVRGRRSSTPAPVEQGAFDLGSGAQ